MSNPYYVEYSPPDGTGTTDCSPSLQSAADALAASVAASPNPRILGTLHVDQRDNVYLLQSPVWLDPRIKILGDGEGTAFSSGTTNGKGLFIVGLRRNVPIQTGIDKILTPDASYRPDAYGILDTTAAPSAGVILGFRANGDAFMQSQASALACGGIGSHGTADNWLETTCLTIEVAVDIAMAAPIATIGDPNAQPAWPFVFYSTDSKTFVFGYAIQTAPNTTPIMLRVDFAAPASGLHRITIQVDLVAKKAAAWVDAIQVAVYTLAIVDGCHFAENDYFPLLIGNAGGAKPNMNSPTGFDFTIYGSLSSKTPRYVFSTISSSQARVDGHPITDRYRYFTPRFSPTIDLDAGTIGYLAFTDPVGQRNLTVTHGTASDNGMSTAFILHCLQTLPGGMAGNSLESLRLVGGQNYGQNVVIGQVIDFEMEKVRSEAAYHAAGSINLGASYLIRLDQCAFDATDSGYYGIDQEIQARSLEFVSAARATIRLVGSKVDFHSTSVQFHTPQNQHAIKMHAGDYGGNYSFTNTTVDYEGSDAFLRSAFYCETHPYTDSTSLRLVDTYLGKVGSGIPAIQLHDRSPRNSPARLFLSNIQADGGSVGPVISHDGTAWLATIDGVGWANPTVAYTGVSTPTIVLVTSSVNYSGGSGMITCYSFVVKDSSITSGDPRVAGLTITVQDLATMTNPTAHISVGLVTIIDAGLGKYLAFYDPAVTGEATASLYTGGSLPVAGDNYIELDMTMDSSLLATNLNAKVGDALTEATTAATQATLAVSDRITPDAGTVSASPAPTITAFTATGANLHAGDGGYTIAPMLVFWTGGLNRGIKSAISIHAVSGSNHAFTIAAVPIAPSSGDTFVIV